jgi:hypothetical protein
MSSRLCRRRAVVAAAGLLLVAGVARAAGLAPDAAGPDPAAVNTLLNVTDSEIVTLDIDTTYGVPVQFVLPVEGEALPLDLEPFSVRAEGYRLLEDRGDGFLHEVDPGPINTLRGVVIGLEGSICAGGMMPDGLYLTVLLPDGRQYWLEPLLGRVPGAGKNHYVVYRNGGVAHSLGICGTTDDQRLPFEHAEHDGHDAPGERGATRWIAQVGTDADYEYYTIWGGTTNAANRISLILNVVNLQYERDVDVFHTISVSIVRTSSADPYTATDEAVMNSQITSAWSPGTSSTSSPAPTATSTATSSAAPTPSARSATAPPATAGPGSSSPATSPSRPTWSPTRWATSGTARTARALPLPPR